MDQEHDFSSNASDDAKSGGHSPEPPPAPHSDAGETVSSSRHHGFTLQPGGRNAIAGTAERIGRAAGSAHRQMRRGLELVRPSGSKGGRMPGYTYAVGSSGHSNALEKEQDEMAAPMMEEEVAGTRGEAAQGLMEFSELAAEGLMAVREGLRDAVSRSRVAARRMVTEHPAQSVTALAGFCIAFGVTLYWCGSRRR